MKKLLFALTLNLICSSITLAAETLTLKDCLSKAALNNLSLKSAAHDSRIAAENVMVAKSGFLPRIDFQGGYTAQLEPQKVNFFPGRVITTQDADYAFFSLSIYQTLYDFGRTEARRDRAALNLDATHSDFTTRQKDIFLRVVEAYYGILEARKFLQAADEEVTQRTAHLKVANNLFEQGVVTRNDLLQAEVKLADSSQRRLAAANRVNNGWLYLNFLTGAEPQFRSELAENNDESIPDTGFDHVEAALKNRPEITTLNKLILAGEAEVKETDRSFYPELFARMGVEYLQNSKVEEQAILAATVGLRINLFDGLATTAKKRQAVQNLSRSNAALDLAREQIRLETMTALNDAGVAAERITTIGKAIQQGEENLRINRDRYLAQVGTATDVLDAQTLLTQIKTDYFRAEFDFRVAVARVKKAMGQL